MRKRRRCLKNFEVIAVGTCFSLVPLRVRCQRVRDCPRSGIKRKAEKDAGQRYVGETERRDEKV